MHVLVCEDDELIASGIVAGLTAQGLTVEHVNTASKARAMLKVAEFDVMVLDLGLPDEDGLKLLQQLRQSGLEIPVLILTARDSVTDRVDGLQAGADDYLLKPFDLRELFARLQTLLRRVAGHSVNLIEHGALTYDPSSRETMLAGQPVDLSRREQSLLQALLHNRGRALSTEQLKDSVYGFNDELESNALNVHIHHLRSKLGKASSKPCAVWAIASARPTVEIKASDEPATALEPDPRRRVRADLGAGSGLDAQRPAQPDDVFPRPASGGFGRMVAGLLEQLPTLPSKGEGTHFSAEQLNIPGGMACQVSSLRGEILARSHNNPEQALEAEKMGFHDQMIDGAPWRSFTLARGDVRITTADRQIEREALNMSILLAAFVPVAWHRWAACACCGWASARGWRHSTVCVRR